MEQTGHKVEICRNTGNGKKGITKKNMGELLYKKENCMNLSDGIYVSSCYSKGNMSWQEEGRNKKKTSRKTVGT